MNRHFSAGGVVYKKTGDTVLFLIRKSSFPNGDWSLPKGWLDDASVGVPGPKTLGIASATAAEIEDTALREVREEGGVEARIISRLGYEKYVFSDENKQKIFKIVTFFLMEYVRDLPQGFGFETSEVRWVDTVEAKILLKRRPAEYELIDKAVTII